ncbi:hypothetical protein AHAS_Ahas15G0143200 [Arachis hypogaea]
MPDVPANRRVERRRRIGTRATDREWRWLDDMIQDDTVGGDGVGHADHRVQRGRPQRRGGTSGIYHEIYGQMYDDLAGSTFTMDMDDQLGSSQFYSDFADLIWDDDPPHFQHQTPQDQVPESQSQMDVVQGYRPDMEEIQRPYDSWFGMRGTPPSAYGMGMPFDPPA